MDSPIIQKLISLFSKFPTIGRRTASRFVFYLIKLPQSELDELIQEMTKLKTLIKICSFCFNPFETTDEEKFCPICNDNSRDKSLLCIVEKENDLISIEKTQKYKGIYFILGGTVSSLKEEDVKKLRIEELEQRLNNASNFKEIIIAINPTPEGETTTLLLERKLKLFPNIKITHLGRGLPVGGELEYADEETLKNAFEGRK